MSTLDIIEISKYSVPAVMGVGVIGALTYQLKQSLDKNQLPSPPPGLAIMSDSPPQQLENKIPQIWSSLEEGVLGLLVFPLWVLILVVNTYLFEGVIETLSDNFYEEFFTLQLWSWQRPITQASLIAVLLCFTQLISGATLFFNLQNKKHFSGFVVLFSLVSLVFSICIEVFGQYLRISQQAQDTEINYFGYIGGGLSLCAACMEIVAGVYLLDKTLIPLISLVARLLFFPFRFVDHYLSYRRPVPPVLLPRQTRHEPILTRMGAALYDAVFEPLAQLDILVGRKLHLTDKNKNTTI